MSKLAATLNAEIRRLAHREARAMAAPLHAAIGQLRREVRRLNHENRALEYKLSQVTPRPAGLTVPDRETMAKARLSPGLIAKLRTRLGLTLNEFAALLGASSGSVFNWEHAKSKPTPAMRARLIAARGLGRREARRLVKAKAVPAKPESGQVSQD